MMLLITAECYLTCGHNTIYDMRLSVNNSNSMFLLFFSAILIGLLVKLNDFYTSIKTCVYESALISQC